MKNIKNYILELDRKYVEFAQSLFSKNEAFLKKHGRLMLFVLGVGLLTLGVSDLAHAKQIVYSQQAELGMKQVIQLIFSYIEGAFGALIMVASGLGAIVSAAFGQYKAALGLFVVAVGAFILRSLVAIFFGDSYATASAGVSQ